MIKHYVIVRTKVRNKDKLLVKLYKNNISVYDSFLQGEYLYLKINHNDLKKLQEKIVTTKFYYVSDSGIYHLKNVLTPLKIISILLFIFLVNIFSQIIVCVDVIHSNKEIREIVSSTLEDYGVKSGRFRKSYEELESIKSDIINMYKDRIEWLEIERVGMKYIVRIEERIINNISNDSKYCHIVAKKSGIITNIRSTKGEVLVKKGDYVNEGDRLISGEIKLNEEIKNNVCAEGDVLAEVWYTTKVSLPIHYQETKRTGKKRYNLMVKTDKNKYKIFNSRLDNYETEETKLFTLFNLTFYKLEEYETLVENKKYNLDDGMNQALKLADEKINLKLKGNEKIHLRKVLKKSINDSTIDIELFYAVIESIAKYEEYSIAIEEEGS